MNSPKFTVTADALYFDATETENGGSPGIRVSSRIEVTAFVRDSESQSWAKLVEWKDADDKAHEWVMPMSATLRDGGEALSFLANGGLTIHLPKLVVEYLRTAKSIRRVCRVPRTGWHKEGDKFCFVRPDKVLGAAGAAVTFAGDPGEQSYAEQNCLEAWQKNVAALCPGNSRLTLAVSCAFAAMLLHFLEEENGGIHLVGPSSCGKTTVAHAAASVFGGPKFIQGWRATDNGLEGVAERHNDALLVLDELGEVDPRSVGSIAYMLANGQGKVRASRTGDARLRKAWRLLFLSTGETTLGQHMSEGGRHVRAGQEVRFVDLRADAGKNWGVFEELHGEISPAAFSVRLSNAAQANYGTASIAFAGQCIEIADELKGLLVPQQREAIADFLNDARKISDVGGQVQRVAERFALIAVAGDLATSFGITGWPQSEATTQAKRCFLDWLTARDSSENSETQAITEAVSGFLDRHRDSRFTDIDDQEDYSPDKRLTRSTNNRAGWRKKVDGCDQFFILPCVFRSEVCAGFDHIHVCQVLAERRCLRSGMEGGKLRYSQKRDIPGVGKRRVYIVTDEIFGG